MGTKWLICMLFTGIFILNSCGSFQVIQGDGNIVTRDIDITEYDEIELAGGKMVVDYIQNENSPAFTITTDQNILEKYEFDISGKTLRVKPKEEFRNANFMPTKFLIETNSQALKRVAGSGSLDFNINSPFQTERLEMRIAGSGKVNMNDRTEFQSIIVGISGSGTINGDQLQGGELEGSISGSGRFNLGGTAQKATFKISGSGRVRGYEMEVEDLECRISGSGSVEMTINNSIDARISGSGSVRYKGNPSHINRSVSGSGSVKKIED